MWPFRRTKKPQTEDASSDEFMQVLSVLSPADIEEIGGIPNEAIAGLVGTPAQDPNTLSAVTGEGFSGDEFRANPTFRTFMQNVIETFGPQDPELREAARRQGHGSVCIIDLRTPDGPMGVVPPEDIIGAFVVEDGKLGGYHPNDKHLVFSANGLVQLPPFLKEQHLQQLKLLRVEQDTQAPHTNSPR